MVFQCINIREVPWEVLKTAAFGLGFQHLPRDLANVNAWRTMFDPYIGTYYFRIMLIGGLYTSQLLAIGICLGTMWVNMCHAAIIKQDTLLSGMSGKYLPSTHL